MTEARAFKVEDEARHTGPTLVPEENQELEIVSAPVEAKTTGPTLVPEETSGATAVDLGPDAYATAPTIISHETLTRAPGLEHTVADTAQTIAHHDEIPLPPRHGNRFEMPDVNHEMNATAQYTETGDTIVPTPESANETTEPTLAMPAGFETIVPGTDMRAELEGQRQALLREIESVGLFRRTFSMGDKRAMLKRVNAQLRQLKGE